VRVRDRRPYLDVTARPSLRATDGVVKDQAPMAANAIAVGTLPVVSATVSFLVGMPASPARKTMTSGML
jgi:hypothetical protein